MTTYEVHKPPSDYDVRAMPKEEIRRYRDWYVRAISERLRALEGAVRADAGFEAWRADATAESLPMLGRWFATQVATRPRTAEELAALKRGLPYPIDIPAVELTDRTFSLAEDIGMYVSEVLRQSIPTLRWDVQLGDKRNVDYGRPILVGSGRVPFCPTQVLTTFAYGLSRGKAGDRLLELYPAWLTTLAPHG